MVFLKLLVVMVLGVVLGLAILAILGIFGITLPSILNVVLGFSCTMLSQFLLADWIFDY